jgi:hypothetical protein
MAVRAPFGEEHFEFVSISGSRRICKPLHATAASPNKNEHYSSAKQHVRSIFRFKDIKHSFTNAYENVTTWKCIVAMGCIARARRNVEY